MLPSYDGTILLIDDDEAVRRVLGRSLRAAGYFVHDFATGEAAVVFVRDLAGPIDLLVTDTALPGMNGVQAALAIRSFRPGLPVVRMSGHAEFSSDDAAIDAWYFVAKPLRGDRLAAMIRAIVGSPARGNQEPAA